MPKLDPASDTACRVLARGKVLRRWRERSRAPDRTVVVLVEVRDGTRYLVCAGHWWSAHEATQADVEAVDRLDRQHQLYNAPAILGESLVAA